MRIVSWNILQGGGKRIHGICDALTSFEADLLVLQEYRHGKTSDQLIDTVSNLGLTYQHSKSPSARKNCLLIASRVPMNCTPWGKSLDASLAIRTSIEIGHQTILLFVGHLPHKKAQVPYWNTLLDSAGTLESMSMIVGDLNCGIPFEDSDTKTFDNTHLFQSLFKQGWIDSWRSRNQSGREFSWISPRGNGYRYDHCLSSSELNSKIELIEYDHSVRESGLSDHSALVIDLKI